MTYLLFLHLKYVGLHVWKSDELQEEGSSSPFEQS
jgi:hypothetical protein